MQLNLQFNFNRFWHLIKNDVVTNYRTLLTAAGAALGILLFINFISMLSTGEPAVSLVFYPLILFIGGYLITSLSFNDLHHPQRSYVFLTLPASNLEKFLSKLVLTTVGYVLGTLILYFLFSVLMSTVNLIIFQESHPLFNPFDRVIWITIGVYLITQSIFMVGAVYFRKHAFIKINLFLFIVQIALALFAVILVKLVFIGYFEGWQFNFDDIKLPSIAVEQRLENFFWGFVQFMKFLFYWVLAPVLWLVSYFRLKETEA